jgi:hypothetical protein
MSRTRLNHLIPATALAFAGWACQGAASPTDGAAGSAERPGMPTAGQYGTAGEGVAPGMTDPGDGAAGQGGTASVAGAGGAVASAGVGGTTQPPSGGSSGVQVPGPAAGDMQVQGPGEFDYAGEAVVLDQDLVVTAGETVRVGPGTTFTAATGVAVRVQGTLVVSGTSDAPVAFLGKAEVPRSWHGIVVAGSGSLMLEHARIGGATYGLYAEVGSRYDVNHAEIGTSFKAAVLFADGVIDHTKFHASGDPTFSPVNEVAVDDVNGTLTIIDASPTVMNSSFDNSSPLVDMIRIGGTASPLFDHVSVTGAHCGFHTFGGINTEPTIRNSLLQGLSYGIMAYTAKPRVDGSNFVGNSADIGFCFGATADNAPTLTGNYYSAGMAAFDPSCFGIATADEAPAAAPLQAGPVGLQ